MSEGPTYDAAQQSRIRKVKEKAAYKSPMQFY